jgi:hypothetical protein
VKKAEFKFSWPILFVGVLGGLAPLLLVLAEMLKEGKPMDWGKTPMYVGSIPLFGIIGGIVASILEDKKLKKIFISGATAPLFLHSMVGDFIKAAPKEEKSTQIISRSDEEKIFRFFSSP